MVRGLTFNQRVRLGDEAKSAATRAQEDAVCVKWGLNRHHLQYYRRAKVPTDGNLRKRASLRPGLEAFLCALIDLGGRLSFGNALLVANAYADVMEEKLVTDSWICRFMRRNKMRSVVPHGERAVSDVEAAVRYVEALVDIIAHATPSLHTPHPSHLTPPSSRALGITDEELCNADETALYYRRSPQAFLTRETSKNVAGGKLPKNRHPLPHPPRVPPSLR